MLRTPTSPEPSQNIGAMPYSPLQHPVPTFFWASTHTTTAGPSAMPHHPSPGKVNPPPSPPNSLANTQHSKRLTSRTTSPSAGGRFSRSPTKMDTPRSSSRCTPTTYSPPVPIAAPSPPNNSHSSTTSYPASKS